MKVFIVLILGTIISGCFLLAPRETCTAHKYKNIESGTIIYCESVDSTAGSNEWEYLGGGHSWWCDEVLSQCALE